MVRLHAVSHSCQPFPAILDLPLPFQFPQELQKSAQFEVVLDWDRLSIGLQMSGQLTHCRIQQWDHLNAFAEALPNHLDEIFDSHPASLDRHNGAALFIM